MTTWTNQTKSPMSTTEVDAAFQDETTISFMDAVNMLFVEASSNALTNLSKS